MIIVREEKPADVNAIRTVNERGFGGPAEARLVDAIRLRKKVFLSLVAEIEDHIVGHILFSPVTIGSAEKHVSAAGLGPMAVLPENQRQGIGSRLVRTGIEKCRTIDIPCIVVLGHPEYYPRFGFVPASKYGIGCEYDVPDEVFMILELRKGALQGQSGTVKYLPEFSNV